MPLQYEYGENDTFGTLRLKNQLEIHLNLSFFALFLFLYLDDSDDAVD